MDVTKLNCRAALCLMFFLNSILTYCQVPDFVKSQYQIENKTKTIRLDSLLKIFAQKAGVVFSFNTEMINPETKIFVSVKQYTLEEILVEISIQMGLQIIKKENYVILRKLSADVTGYEEKNYVSDDTFEKLKRLKSINSKNDAESIIYNESNALKKKEDHSKNENILALKDFHQEVLSGSKMIRKYLETPKSFHFYQDSIIKFNQQDAWKTEEINPGNTDQLAIPTKNQNLFFKMGVSIDEVLFFGSMMHFGVPAFFGTFSWNTNFDVSQTRFGVGSTLPLTGNMNVVLLLNGGNLNRNTFVMDTSFTTTEIVISSFLLRFNPLVEFKIGKRFGVQFGPQFNLLYSSYTVNGKKLGLSVIDNSGDEFIYTIDPPYRLIDTYSSNRNSSSKGWIGIQLNFIYWINFSKNK